MKVSDDGATVSQIGNFILLSFSLLSDGCKMKICKCLYKYSYMSHTGNHTVGIVAGSEYDILKDLCKELFGEINELFEKGETEVDGHKIPLEFYLSGDYFSYANICPD